MKLKVVLLSLIFIASIVSCQNNSYKDVKISSPEDSLSYAIGLELGKNFVRQELEVDIDVLIAAIKSGYIDSVHTMTEDQTREIITMYQYKKDEERKAKRNADAEKNIKEGEVFLEKNKSKEDVITTESGLQYKVLKKGNGPKPKDTDRVSVHYKGTLLDGTEFDSSIKRGEPATFAVKGVIRGWSEALQLMNVGSKYELYIPGDLAYGPRGNRNIPPNATLIFEVELLSIENSK